MEWALDARGRLPAKGFFDGLAPPEQAKSMALFKRMASTGKVQNREQFKKVEGSTLFEFKGHQVRFLGDFRPGNRFIIAVGRRKKKDKLDDNDIEAAKRVLRENDEFERGAR